jgi:hypothetical protein
VNASDLTAKYSTDGLVPKVGRRPGARREKPAILLDIRGIIFLIVGKKL